MSIFKILNFENPNQLKLLERLNYIREPVATETDLMTTVYMSSRYPYEEMIFIKQCHRSAVNDTFQGKQFIEFVLSLTSEESLYGNDFVACIKEIDSYLAHYSEGHYQLISCIHINTDNLHAHVIMNNTDFMTGKRLVINKADFFAICENINQILNHFDFSNLEQLKKYINKKTQTLYLGGF